MRIQIKPTSILSEAMPLVEQVCADVAHEDRQYAFLLACIAEGLTPDDRVVRTLADDLEYIRPPDAWLRIIAAHLTEEQRVQLPLKALDYGLSSLRLVDAYLNRSNLDLMIAVRLLAVVVRQLPYPAVERWRDWHTARALVASAHGDVFSHADVFRVCSDVGRYAPLSMVTVVGSQFGDWAKPFTPIVNDLTALEYCASEIVAWRRGRRGRRGLNARWAENPPDADERSDIEATLNRLAESVYVNWQSLKACVSPQWFPILDQTIEAAIQFAVVSLDVMKWDNDG